MTRTTRPLDRMLSDRAAQPTGEDRTPAGPLTTLACKRRQFNYSVVKWTRQLDALCACAIRRSDRCHVDSWLARPQKCMDSNVSVSCPLLDAESGLPNPLVRTQYMWNRESSALPDHGTACLFNSIQTFKVKHTSFYSPKSVAINLNIYKVR